MDAMIRRLAPVPALMFLAIWLVLLAGGRSRLLRDPGTLWHTVVGRQILTTGELIRTDPFSCRLRGHPWIAMQWLGECLMAVVHAICGIDGLLLMTATVLAALFAWLGARLARRGCHWLPASVVVALAIYSSSYHFHCRPHLWTMVFLAVVYAWLVDVEAGRRRLRSLVWLIPLCVIWTNVHAGVLGGIATVVLVVSGWGLESLVFRKRGAGGPEEAPAAAAERSPGSESIATPGPWPKLPAGPTIRVALLPGLSLLVLACGASILVNPYGLALPRVWFALNDSTVLPTLIEEHGRIDPGRPEELGLVLFGLGYGVALLGVLPQRPRVTWLVPLVWLALALGRIRHGPLFAITATIGLAELLPYTWYVRRAAARGSDLFVPPTEDPVSQDRLPEAALAPTVLVVLALALKAIGIPLPVLGSGWARLAAENFPVALVPALDEYQQQSTEPTPVFNELNFGGFLIYFAPKLRVFIDDRCELYGDAGLLEYVEARERHPERINRWAEEYGIELALVSAGSNFDRFLANAPKWSQLQRTDTAVLYRRLADQ